MKSIVFFVIALSLLLLQSSCFSNKAMFDGEEEEPAFEVVETEAIIHDDDRKQPIAIIGGIENKKLFAGMPNTIKIYVEGGNTEHLVVTCNGGRLIAADPKNGLYSFSEREAGFVTEIIVKDTVTGAKLFKTFDVVDIPAPEAYIGIYKMSFKGKLVFDAATFRKQSALIVQYREEIPARCNADSYTMVRIDKNGKMSSCENKNRTGRFDEATEELVRQAQSGDLYIIKDIYAACSKKHIKNIVYEIK